MSQDDQDPNDIVATTMTADPFPFERLPVELRASVLAQMPDSDLWRSCHTSRSLRSEAARQLLLQAGLDIIINSKRITSSLSIDMIDAESKVPLTVTVHVKARRGDAHLCCQDAEVATRIETLRKRLAHKGLSKANIGVFNIVYEDTRVSFLTFCKLPELFETPTTKFSTASYTLQMISEGVSTEDTMRTREEREGISQYLVSLQSSPYDTTIYQGVIGTADYLVETGLYQSAGSIMMNRRAVCTIIGMTQGEADEQDWREQVARSLAGRPSWKGPRPSWDTAVQCVNAFSRFMSTEEFQACEAGKLLAQYREQRRQNQAEVYLIPDIGNSESEV